MKKITLAFIGLLVFNIAKASDEPKLVLEYTYTNKADSVYIVNNIKNDKDLCCTFTIVLSKSKTGDKQTFIKHKETGVLLGTIYGTPTKEFLAIIEKNYLNEQYIKDVVPKMVALSSVSD